MKRLPMLAASLPMAEGSNPTFWEVRASNSERALARARTTSLVNALDAATLME